MAIANETIEERPVSSVFSAGRMFYLVNNIIYYSQVMEGNNIAFLTKCYQKNDPTAEQLSDLLATDGGTITVNEANKGVRLMSIAGGILILCDNGVWQLSGPESGFTATNFSIIKVSSHGCTSAQSVVQVSDAVFYWGEKHIHAVQKNEFGVLNEVKLSESTIENFYNEIGAPAKKHSYGFYNSADNQIEWFYSSLQTEGGSDLIYAHDRGIVLDLKTGGFFPQKFNGKTVQSDTIGTSLIGGTDLSSIRTDGIFYLSFTQDVIASVSQIVTRIGKRDSIIFQDFSTDFPIAFIETGYETLGKPSNKKVAPYITTHFRQTEQNFVADGSGGLKLDLQSGCQLRSQWNWNNSPANGKFGAFQQVYRFQRIFVPDVAGPFDSGNTVISTKNKVRGRGNALSLRFEQEPGKDMQVLGYTIQWSVKGRM